MEKTVTLEWQPDPDDGLIAELDKEFEYKEARAERLAKIAKADKGGAVSFEIFIC